MFLKLERVGVARSALGGGGPPGGPRFGGPVATVARTADLASS